VELVALAHFGAKMGKYAAEVLLTARYCSKVVYDRDDSRQADQ